jgi:monovalent cation:H+ antiporter-2, CPA2 family
MHEAQRFLQDLALVLSVAAVVTILFRLLRQPIVLGYLLAGVILGPNIPIPLFADQDRIRTLAELGVILVMFSIGLEFSIRRLLAILPTSGLTGAIQLSGMFWLGYGVGQIFGWSGEESLFAGAMVAISSTMIVARTFAEEKVDGKLQEIVLGVLVVQDLAAVVLMAVLTAIAAGRGAASEAVVETTGELAAFLVVAVVIGFLIVPRAVRALFRLDSRETVLVACVGFCFALALLAHELGYSVALGAFLAGSLIAESGHGEEVEQLIHPLRELFAAVFFVAVGMMVDPLVIIGHWKEVVALTVIVLVGQSALVALGTFLAGNDVRSSVRAGMSMAQIGEFSFIIAGIGIGAGVIGEFLYPVAVAVCLLTSFATPWMVRLSGRAARAIERRLPPAIQTFTSLYGSWREQLRRRQSRATAVGRRVRRMIGLLLLDGAILAGVLIAAAIAHDRYLPSVRERLSLSPTLAVVLLVALTAVLALPFAIGLVRVTRGLGTLLARLVLPSVKGGALDLAAAPRRMFVVTLQLAMMLLVGLPFLALTRPFLPFWVGLLLLAAAMVALGISLWRSARNLEEHVRAGAHLVLETLVRHAGEPTPQRAQLVEVTSALPGLGELTAVTLEPTSPAVGRTLIDLDLRGLTGASVIAISRAEGGVAAPTGREQLAAGDVLTLTGTTDAVAAAASLLLEPTPPPPAMLRS